LIDCRSLVATPVPAKFDGAVVLICDSRVHHEHASSAYNERRAECRSGVEILAQRLPQISALRDVDATDLERLEGLLPEPIRARCRHVVSENARTLAAVDALRDHDLAGFGRLMLESHTSLRDDYQVSCEELDTLVEIARAEPGVYGARMTGGGFGGCTVNLVQTSALERVSSALTRGYYRAHGREPRLFVTGAAEGARHLG
jgi:galactokinase